MGLKSLVQILSREQVRMEWLAIKKAKDTVNHKTSISCSQSGEAVVLCGKYFVGIFCYLHYPIYNPSKMFVLLTGLP